MTDFVVGDIHGCFEALKIVLKNKSNVGEDNLILFFEINKKADLLVKFFDIKDEFLGEYNLGNIS